MLNSPFVKGEDLAGLLWSTGAGLMYIRRKKNLNTQSSKKIDGVLNALSEGNSYYKRAPEMQTSAGVHGLIEILTILERLEDEGYVKSKIDPAKKNDWAWGPMWALKHKGFILIEEGGYARMLLWKKVIDFPKKYWLLISFTAFVIGVYNDDIKGYFSNAKVPQRDTILLKQDIQVKIDTLGIRKIPHPIGD